MIIIRSVFNLSSSPINIFIPGFDADHHPVIVAPSTTLDLLSVITEDDLIAIQGQLNGLVNHIPPIFSVAATIDTVSFEEGYTGGSGTAQFLPTGTSEPGSPVVGQLFFNTTTHQAEVWNGSSWSILG